MNDDGLDIREILRIIKKRRKLIIAIVGLFVALSIVISLAMPPTYEAQVNLRVKYSRGVNEPLAPGDVPNESMIKKVLTYAEIVKSRTVVQAAIDEMYAAREDKPLLEDVQKRIATMPVKNTEILGITVQAGTAENAQEFANLLAEKFIDRLTYLLRQEQRDVRIFLSERLEDSKKELARAQKAMIEYKQKEKIATLSDETKAAIDRQAALKSSINDNQVALTAAQAKLRTTSEQISKESPGFAGDNALIQHYQIKMADQEAALIRLQQKYTDKHPQVVAAKTAVEETRTRLQAEIARVVNGEAASSNPVQQALLAAKLQAESDIAVGSARQAALQQAVREPNYELSQVPIKEQGLADVTRDLLTAQDTYTMLAKRHEEARISEVMQPKNVQIVDLAALPLQPIRPKPLLYAIVALFLGSCAGIVTVLVAEQFRNTIESVDDVKRHLGLLVIGNIPNYDIVRKGRKKSWWNKLWDSLAPKGRGVHHG